MPLSAPKRLLAFSDQLGQFPAQRRDLLSTIDHLLGLLDGLLVGYDQPPFRCLYAFLPLFYGFTQFLPLFAYLFRGFPHGLWFPLSCKLLIINEIVAIP